MKNKFLLLVLVVLFLSPSAMALTAQERKIVQAAQAQIEIAMRDYAAAKTALATADQRAVDAEAHAATTAQSASILQSQVDAAYLREKALATDNAKMKPVYEEVNKYWGIGGIFYGIKQLMKHLIIAALVIIGVVILILVGMFVLSIFFPWIRPIFGVITSTFAALWARLLSMFKPKPTPPPAP